MKPHVAIAALLGAGCASVERPDDWHRRMPEPPGAFAAPGPFDPMTIDGIWGVGDTVVYAIDLDDAGTHHEFTFSLTTTQLPPSTLDVLDEAHPVHGHVLTRSSSIEWQLDPVAYTGTGTGTLRAELRGADGTCCGGEIRAELIAHWFVDEMGVGIETGVSPVFAALLSLDCMHATLLRVIRPPGTLSVLANFGRISVGLGWPRAVGAKYVDQETPFGVLPTVWLPIAITANGQPALDGRMQFTWKRPPLLLAAGVLQVEAWHPDDPTRRIRIRLASARRGTPPDAVAADDLGLDLRAGMTVAEVLAVADGETEEVHERGRLADGRAVELVEFDVPYKWLFGVVHEGRLLFTSLGPDLSRDYLRRRGFVAVPPTSASDR